MYPSSARARHLCLAFVGVAACALAALLLTVRANPSSAAPHALATTDPAPSTVTVTVIPDPKTSTVTVIPDPKTITKTVTKTQVGPARTPAPARVTRTDVAHATSVDHVTNVNDVTNTNVVTNTAHATRTRLANVTNTQSLTQTAFATSYRTVSVKQLLAKPTTKSAIARTAIGTAGLGISAAALFGLARMRRRGDHLG